jgi:hypothetical protein
MPTRTADDAGLPGGPTDRDAIRPRTDDHPVDDDYELDAANLAANLDILNHVPPPPLDPLQIHGWDTLKALENVNLAQATIWTNMTQAKVWAYRAYGGKLENTEEVILARELIKSALGLEQNPAVGPPVAETISGRKDFPPHCALVSTIPP